MHFDSCKYFPIQLYTRTYLPRLLVLVRSSSICASFPYNLDNFREFSLLFAGSDSL